MKFTSYANVHMYKCTNVPTSDGELVKQEGKVSRCISICLKSKKAAGNGAPAAFFDSI